MADVRFSKLTGLAPRTKYSLQDLTAIEIVLAQNRTLEIRSNRHGLFPASSGQAHNSISGYQHTWLRDNIMTANSLMERGSINAAHKTVQAITAFFIKYRYRFDDIISGKIDPGMIMTRPHTRFDGERLEELPGKWAYAQNDALGYVLWLRFRLANQYKHDLAAAELDIYSCFPRYFDAIQYWNDADSGHWEENREVRNSSIGAVVAGLKEMKHYIETRASQPMSYDGQVISERYISRLIESGRVQLSTLPRETATRLTDAALLFLIYPLGILERSVEDSIIDAIVGTLRGEYGIRRYLGDSYWAPGYKHRLSELDRTRDYSDDVNVRNILIPKERYGHDEAQWCIFDPILSVIYGLRFIRYHEDSDKRLQIEYFNRSLSQITSDGRCPEAYYIEDERRGEFVPNDHTPLVWTQANLDLAIEFMKRSAK